MGLHSSTLKLNQSSSRPESCQSSAISDIHYEVRYNKNRKWQKRLLRHLSRTKLVHHSSSTSSSHHHHSRLHNHHHPSRHHHHHHNHHHNSPTKYILTTEMQECDDDSSESLTDGYSLTDWKRYNSDYCDVNDFRPSKSLGEVGLNSQPTIIQNNTTATTTTTTTIVSNKSNKLMTLADDSTLPVGDYLNASGFDGEQQQRKVNSHFNHNNNHDDAADADDDQSSDCSESLFLVDDSSISHHHDYHHQHQQQQQQQKQQKQQQHQREDEAESSTTGLSSGKFIYARHFAENRSKKGFPKDLEEVDDDDNNSNDDDDDDDDDFTDDDSTIVSKQKSPINNNDNHNHNHSVSSLTSSSANYYKCLENKMKHKENVGKDCQSQLSETQAAMKASVYINNTITTTATLPVPPTTATGAGGGGKGGGTTGTGGTAAAGGATISKPSNYNKTDNFDSCSELDCTLTNVTELSRHDFSSLDFHRLLPINKNHPPHSHHHSHSHSHGHHHNHHHHQSDKSLKKRDLFNNNNKMPLHSTIMAAIDEENGNEITKHSEEFSSNSEIQKKLKEFFESPEKEVNTNDEISHNNNDNDDDDEEEEEEEDDNDNYDNYNKIRKNKINLWHENHNNNIDSSDEELFDEIIGGTLTTANTTTGTGGGATIGGNNNLLKSSHKILVNGRYHEIKRWTNEQRENKVFCYKVWVKDTQDTWKAFHNPTDRRIESIGRASDCRIHLTNKLKRGTSGFLNRKIIIYAPSLQSLEKCCYLFDDKFPKFYVSGALRKDMADAGMRSSIKSL